MANRHIYDNVIINMFTPFMVLGIIILIILGIYDELGTLRFWLSIGAISFWIAMNMTILLILGHREALTNPKRIRRDPMELYINAFRKKPLSEYKHEPFFPTDKRLWSLIGWSFFFEIVISLILITLLINK